MSDQKAVIGKDMINLMLLLDATKKALDAEYDAVKESAKEMLKAGAQQDTGADGFLKFDSRKGRIDWAKGFEKYGTPEFLAIVAKIESDDTLRGKPSDSLTPVRVNGKEEAANWVKDETNSIIKEIESVTKAHEEATVPVLVVAMVETKPQATQEAPKTQDQGGQDQQQHRVWP